MSIIWSTKNYFCPDETKKVHDRIRQLSFNTFFEMFPINIQQNFCLGFTSVDKREAIYSFWSVHFFAVYFKNFIVWNSLLNNIKVAKFSSFLSCFVPFVNKEKLSRKVNERFGAKSHYSAVKINVQKASNNIITYNASEY